MINAKTFTPELHGFRVEFAPTALVDALRRRTGPSNLVQICTKSAVQFSTMVQNCTKNAVQICTM